MLADLIYNYRTIISHGNNVDKLVAKYESLVDEKLGTRNFNTHIAGAAFGFSSCIRFLYIGLVFYIGATFISSLDITSDKVYKAVIIIFTTAMGAGLTLRTVPDTTGAKESAEKIFEIIDKEVESNSIDNEEDVVNAKGIDYGKIEFKNITFKYPNTNTNVL